MYDTRFKEYLLINDTGYGLERLTEESFNEYFQISPENPMVGVASRVRLLNDLGASLLQLPEIFGESGRPGNMVGKCTPAISVRA